ncbi:MAG: hypothetical protein AB9835_10415 [Eubacteriales bacterium]
MRELIQKYIVRVDVDDDILTIYAVKDLSSPSSYMLDDKKEQRLEDNSKALNTAGCGGAQHSLPTILYEYMYVINC